MNKKDKQDRHVQTKRRERILAALPAHARTVANDDSYSNEPKLQYASIHIHPKLFDLCHIDNRNHRRLPHSIPYSVGLDLTKNTVCTFTKADLIPNSKDGECFPIPNYPISNAFEDAITLEKKMVNSPFNDFAPIVSPPSTRSGSGITQINEIAEMRRELDQRMKTIEHLEKVLQDKEKQCSLWSVSSYGKPVSRKLYLGI
eukprot:CAMPEP_0201654182 /NCGR_PEP_ID=MMETSP0493-20130528/45367_1 /ASSEMBLY_ACC=CAM_ASM_000838 /TAXON_ID=420259 /ORGANISM="Thalassiosira gravida, Strain GMp14c1" /LENGTH=200 /DNA_ID=CAMNT_0048130731 /DNA_START=196 /DNA_END=798 /DNA_ORIENTATION=-